MEIVRQKNVATYIVFPLVDADGDLVSGATSLDSEIDQFADGSAPNGFADCTNEATEIGSTGNYYLSLTQTEMNQDYIIVQIKSGTAKTQVVLIRTMVGDPLNLAVTDDGGAINVGSGIVEAQVKSIDNNVITTASINDGAFTAAKFASDFLTAAKIASDVGTEIAAAVWNALTSGLSTASSIGKLLVDNVNATISSRASQTSVDTIDDFLDTEIAAILADTNELQTDWVNGGRLDLLIDAIKAKTDNLPADPADASDIAALISGIETKIDTIDDFLDTEVAAILADTNELQTDWANGGRLDLLIDAIKAKTDNLPTDPADQSALEALLTAIDDYLDTEIAAIKAKTDQLTFTTANQVDATTVTNSDKTGYGLSSSAIQAIWDALTSALTTVGSIGKLLVDNINATISSRASQTSLDTVDDLLDTEVAAIKAKTDNLPSDPADASDIASSHASLSTKLDTIDDLIDTEIGTLQTDVTAIKAKTDNLPVAVKKNTALSNFEFYMVDTDGAAVTGLTVAAERSIDGGAFAACANSATEVGSGVYKIDLAAADLNGSVITLKFTASGAKARVITIVPNA